MTMPNNIPSVYLVSMNCVLPNLDTNLFDIDIVTNLITKDYIAERFERPTFAFEKPIASDSGIPRHFIMDMTADSNHYNFDLFVKDISILYTEGSLQSTIQMMFAFGALLSGTGVALSGAADFLEAIKKTPTLIIEKNKNEILDKTKSIMSNPPSGFHKTKGIVKENPQRETPLKDTEESFKIEVFDYSIEGLLSYEEAIEKQKELPQKTNKKSAHHTLTRTTKTMQFKIEMSKFE